MKVIVAGSRSVDDIDIIQAILDSAWCEFTELVSGGARGVDSLAEAWARQNSVPVKTFIPDWDKYGKSAGPRRNVVMANYADALIAIWDGKSRGTSHMIREALARNMKVWVYEV